MKPLLLLMPLVIAAEPVTQPPLASWLVIYSDGIYTPTDWDHDRLLIESVRQARTITMTSTLDDGLGGPAVTVTTSMPANYLDRRLLDCADRMSRALGRLLSERHPTPDLDGDGDCDQSDFGMMMNCLGAPGSPWATDCLVQPVQPPEVPSE